MDQRNRCGDSRGMLRLAESLLLTGLLVCGGLAPGASAEGQAPHIPNPAQPLQGTDEITLEELWRIGGEDDELFFGVVSQILADSLGNLYLLDSQLSEVQVYSPGGEHLRTLSREGDGPGEIRNPADLFFMPGGRSLAMVQTFPGRVVIIDLAGDPAGGFRIGAGDPSQGGFGVLITGRSQGDALVLGGIHMRFSGQGVNDQEFFLARHSIDGTEQTRYLTKSSQINFAEFVISEAGMDFVWGGRWDVAPDGRVFANPERNAYAIEVYAPDGELERVIERQYESWERDQPALREARLLMDAVGRNYPAPPQDVEILETEPNITGLYCRSGGELWVRTSRADRERPAGVLTTFDLFDAEGLFQRQLLVRGPGNPREDSIFLIGEDRLVLVTQALAAYRSMQGVGSDEAEPEEEIPMEVICFHMKR
ncbi:MAG: hypothetical protein KAY32_13265 [Candidatus Eisenbacteria sp.]|nr:hypothetical protein [Candidatus Eisenbacteria bacterium]